jgi:hypothetical protein
MDTMMSRGFSLVGWPSRAHVGDDDAPILGQLQFGSQCWSYGLRVRANGSLPNPSVLPQFVKHEADGRLRNRETETFAAATCAQDECIDPNQTAIPIDQGTIAVTGVNGRVSLYVHHGSVQFRLSSHSAHDPLGDGVIQSLGRSDRQHSLSKPHAELLGQRNKRKRLSSILIKARSTFRLAPISLAS